ncbi:hypothetical protein CFK41_16440 [Brachybacterium ginsengisoli]|uniref:DUF624 domain-containing protein n=1 Tax=Brachybacterium ginsengisoli TaxID=1331682 RepID=A0A291H132_9MICO|nr:DUF624 domain-containing protein [Brachybacterium ginsengisoli]ATG56189.1 hypothetical protein CFK41_16440 [Brachybacterium ginsengisoli]
MTPPRRPRGLFTDLTEGVYWFLVLDLMLVLAAVPTILLWTVMSPGPLGALLFVVAALPLLPALAAGLYACRSWREERELIPARQFLRGYRLNALDALKVGTPALLVMALAAFNLTRSSSPGLGAGEIAFLVVGVAALLVLLRALSIVSRFSFRVRDALRLTAFTLLVTPLSTLALLSLGVLTLGIVLMIGEFLLPVVASLLVFALWASERPVVRLLTEQFTTGPTVVSAES